MYVPEPVIGRELLEDYPMPGQRHALRCGEPCPGRSHTLALYVRVLGELDLSNPAMDDLGTEANVRTCTVNK